jgi:cytochrome o ubiquinol oxidase subunit 2
MHRIKFSLFSVALLVLSGCDLVAFNASGDVARQQGDLIVYATVLMLIVIVPVIFLTAYFAFAYRSSNKDARYEPDWDHSVSLEIVIWAVPLAIVICLAGLTWVATHRLDPYKDLIRVSEDKPLDPEVKPLTIEVVAMDWKWLFIYPEYGIASVNEVAGIVDRPVEWKLTSTTVMNAFHIPDMSGMIYAMAGMETELNGVMNAPGSFEGHASHYNGSGFSKMTFEYKSLDQDGFDAWVEKVRAAPRSLDRSTFTQLEQPTIDHPVTYYSGVEDQLWTRIVNMCVDDDELCMHDMMMGDALGGGGIDGLYNREIYRGICSADDPRAMFSVLRPDLLHRADELIRTASTLTPPSSISLKPETEAN